MSIYWTPEKDKEMIALRVKGNSFRAIADKISEPDFRVTRNACLGRWHRLGLPSYVTRATQSQVYKPRPKRLPGASKQRPKAPRRERPISAFAQYMVADDRPLREPIITPEPKLLKLADLRDDKSECRFHVGDVGEPNSGFCAHPVVPGLPYCEAHARLCYSLAPPPKSVRPTVSVSQKETEVAV